MTLALAAPADDRRRRDARHTATQGHRQAAWGVLAFISADTLLLSGFAAMGPWHEVAPALKVTVSDGVATHRPGETIAQLLARADGALYAAKRSGRNCVKAG